MTRAAPTADRSDLVSTLIGYGWRIRPQTVSTGPGQWTCLITKDTLRLKVSPAGDVEITNADRTLSIGYDPLVSDMAISDVLDALAKAEAGDA